ncbi:hypothetical protein [Paludisphaera soli]|uniref:hypothetical protein n=1 Tax=Paludisphaera soli TaxID=2712865 RepID=UPI0013EB9790|nr:hypothetical protein [Paludisphaera soli]
MKATLARYLVAGIVLASSARAEEPPKDKPAESALTIDKPVVCRTIGGFEDYEKLPNASQTSDEKLLVYYRPRGYEVAPKGDRFAARFTQDGQVRAKGKKKVLLRKAKLLDYEAVADRPPREVYLQNTFSLKGLPPGEYEYDVILRDENARTSATATVEFRVVPARLPKAED